MAGRWKHIVKVGWGYTDAKRPWEERRDCLVARLRDATPTLPAPDHAIGDYPDLGALIDAMATAPTTERFEVAWDLFYDYADEYGVWVDTFCDDPADPVV